MPSRAKDNKPLPQSPPELRRSRRKLSRPSSELDDAPRKRLAHDRDHDVETVIEPSSPTSVNNASLSAHHSTSPDTLLPSADVPVPLLTARSLSTPHLSPSRRSRSRSPPAIPVPRAQSHDTHLLNHTISVMTDQTNAPTSTQTIPNDTVARSENGDGDASTISGWAPSDDEGPPGDVGGPEPVPALANNHPDFTDVNYIPYQALQRATAFARKHDEPNNRYAISELPRGAAWGTTTSTERVLCYNDRPITVWLLGVVVSRWFTNSSGVPQQRVNIGLRLPYRDDQTNARQIYRFARPERGYDKDIIYASKYMGQQTRGSPETTALLFQDVYDAQYRFRAKREMSLIPASFIAKNDLVLVETAITRWKSAKDRKNKRDWKLWDVGFELQAISLLFEAPVAADDRVYGVNENIHDDM